MEKLSGIIYVIKNEVNGKVYIGQTIKTFQKRYLGKWWETTRCSALKADGKEFGEHNFTITIKNSNDLNLDEKELIDSFPKDKLYNGTNSHANYGPKKGQRKRYKEGVETIFKNHGLELSSEIIELITITSSGSTKDGHAKGKNIKSSKATLEAMSILEASDELKQKIDIVLKEVIENLSEYGYNGGSIGRLTGNLKMISVALANVLA